MKSSWGILLSIKDYFWDENSMFPSTSVTVQANGFSRSKKDSIQFASFLSSSSREVGGQAILTDKDILGSKLILFSMRIFTPATSYIITPNKRI